MGGGCCRNLASFEDRAGGGEALTAAKGIAVMGAEEAGTRVVWVAGGAVGAEAPTPAATSSRRDRTSASLARFSAFNTIPAPKEGEIRT